MLQFGIAVVESARKPRGRFMPRWLRASRQENQQEGVCWPVGIDLISPHDAEMNPERKIIYVCDWKKSLSIVPESVGEGGNRELILDTHVVSSHVDAWISLHTDLPPLLPAYLPPDHLTPAVLRQQERPR